jgi:hypothetical protein
MVKLAALVTSSLVGLGLAAFFPPPSPPDDGPPPHKAKEKVKKAKRKEEAKKKERPGPEGDLRRAYDLLRRLRADDPSAGRPEERLKDWTDRAAGLYRDGLKAFAGGDARLAHEYALAAHDLARAVDHARNASRFDRPDRDLPSPPDPGDRGERLRHDLERVYDRIGELGRGDKRKDQAAPPEASYYLKAARDLYNAARRDAEAGRNDRAGELARAAEAMTHVPDHLGRVAEADADADGRGRGDRRGREPKRPPRDRRAGELPPPLPE